MVPGLNRLRPRSVSGPAIVMTVAVVVALCTFIHRKPALLGVEPGSSQQMYWMAGVIAAGVVFLIIMGGLSSAEPPRCRTKTLNSADNLPPEMTIVR
ncbi:ImcF domain-containing protein [Escherichia coli]|nr:ImcF domain-containing protein [Escherichia coli]